MKRRETGAHGRGRDRALNPDSAKADPAHCNRATPRLGGENGVLSGKVETFFRKSTTFFEKHSPFGDFFAVGIVRGYDPKELRKDQEPTGRSPWVLHSSTRNQHHPMETETVKLPCPASCVLATVFFKIAVVTRLRNKEKSRRHSIFEP